MTAPLLNTAANGHNWLAFEALNTPKWNVALEWLKRDGFVESGSIIRGIDEGILPSFVKQGVTVAAGFDNWSGNYLLAQCQGGDRVILELAKHVAAQDRRSTA